MKLHLLLVWLHSMEFHLSEPLATSSAPAQQQSPPLLLLLLLIRSLRLRRTPDGLGSVLALFPCLLHYQHSSNILNHTLPRPRLFLPTIIDPMLPTNTTTTNRIPKENLRCCLLAFSIFVACPYRTSR